MSQTSHAGCLGLSLAISSSRSFKVIDVDIPEKVVTSACYDEQHVCTYLQPFSRCRTNQ